jgi:hypothetical protein
LLKGTAVLAIWNDIRPETEDEFNRWHTREHLPERIATPGILTGRRYANYEAKSFRYYTMYEAAAFDVFASEGYFATANSPSEWSPKVQKDFYNFARQACHTVMTRGRGVGGAMATARIVFPPRSPDPGAREPKEAMNAATRRIIEQAMQIECVTAAHLCTAGTIARVPSRKGAIQNRPNTVRFDAVLMVEAMGRPQLTAALPKIDETLRREGDCIASFALDVYDLACYFEAGQ